MFDWLNAVVCFFSNFVAYVQKAAVWVVNAFIESVGVAAALLVAAFPDMPEFPDSGGEGGWLAWLSWAFPLQAFVSIWASIVTMVLILYGLRIAARWVKLL